MPKDEKPFQAFNLVIYYKENKDLVRQKQPPIFLENVYIYTNDYEELYAYNVENFTEGEECLVASLKKVISTSFKFPGIFVSGLEYATGKDSLRAGEIVWYQKWLITTLSKEALEKETYD